MAQFQTRHKRQGGSGYLLKVLGALIGLGMLIYIIWALMNLTSSSTSIDQAGEQSAKLLHNTFYNLSYDTMQCRPLWGTYSLEYAPFDSTAANGREGIANDRRIPDSCNRRIQSMSGIKAFFIPRMHMQFDTIAQREATLSSNVVKLKSYEVWKAYKRWNRSVIAWLKEKDKLHLCVGFSKRNQLFAAVAVQSDTGSAIGMIFDDRQVGIKSLEELFLSIDQVEERSGINIFEEILSPDIEKHGEIGHWPLINENDEEAEF